MKRLAVPAAAAALYICLFLLASPYDLPVSYRLTSAAVPAIVETGARIGPLPEFLVPAWCLRSFETEGKQGNLLRIIEAVLCICCGVNLVDVSPRSLSDLLLAAGLSILIYVLLRKLPLPEQSEKNRMILKLAVCAGAATFLNIHLFKMIWGRPRFIAIMNDGAQFRQWYEIAGFAFWSDYYKSFPSGHTSASSSMFFLIVLPVLFPQLKKSAVLCRTVPVLFTPVVAFSRIMAGMHFITDVMAAFAIYMFWVQLALFYFLKYEAAMRQEDKK